MAYLNYTANQESMAIMGDSKVAVVVDIRVEEYEDQALLDALGIR